MVLAQLAKAGAFLLGLVVLSRLLTPADFGFVAVPIAIVGVGEIIRDLGISTATVTAERFTTNIRNVLFWVNTAIGAALCALMSLGGLLFSSIFADPRIAGVTAALSLVFLINGLSAQYRAGLTRDLRFKAIALTDVCAAAVGITAAIMLALAGASYWAIVVQQVSIAAVGAALLIAMGAWLPRRPQHWRESAPILKFGLSVSASQAMLYLGNNADTFALGITSSASQLGFYTRAFQVAMQPFAMIKAPLTSIALPSLSRRVHDQAAYERGVLFSQLLLAYTVVPLAALLAACALPTVEIFLGSQWLPSVPILTVLAVACALQQLVSVASWMLLSKNLAKSLRQFTMFSVAVKVALIATAASFGPFAVAIAFLASVTITSPIAIIVACRGTGISARQLILRMIAPVALVVLAGCAAAAAVWLTRDVLAVVSLSAGVAVFLGIYGLSLLVPRIRQDVTSVVRILR